MISNLYGTGSDSETSIDSQLRIECCCSNERGETPWMIDITLTHAYAAVDFNPGITKQHRFMVGVQRLVDGTSAAEQASLLSHREKLADSSLLHQPSDLEMIDDPKSNNKRKKVIEMFGHVMVERYNQPDGGPRDGTRASSGYAVARVWESTSAYVAAFRL
ncbi:uncharacterized protein LOC126235272 [Schistocerca nitens]|uniref:uncharacterized protein LOC126235272 n=1 Tax=Schistocerca nitens TaxID=7011 RepID=UPI0021186C19|nr:uncharacterized protein LOC126235272 [Schistocerca nitens]